MRGYVLSTALVTSLLLAGAANAQSTIRPGETQQGALSKKDSRLDDDSYYRCYVIATAPDHTYTVSMSSSDFDTFLAAGPGSDCGDGEVFNDDGPNMGTDSQLQFTSTGGNWFIRANTLASDEVGRFTLRVSDGRIMPPTTQIVPISVGESIQGELQHTDRRADDGSFYDCYSLNIRQAGTVAVRLDSGDFDAYLGLYNGGRCEGAAFNSDDDSGGGTSAQIVETLRPGSYSIRANTLSSNETGSYNLTVTSRR